MDSVFALCCNGACSIPWYLVFVKNESLVLSWSRKESISDVYGCKYQAVLCIMLHNCRTGANVEWTSSYGKALPI